MGSMAGGIDSFPSIMNVLCWLLMASGTERMLKTNKMASMVFRIFICDRNGDPEKGKCPFMGDYQVKTANLMPKKKYCFL
jgi:hypothetical protein